MTTCRLSFASTVIHSYSRSVFLLGVVASGELFVPLLTRQPLELNHLRVHKPCLSAMETVDIHHLKAGEVNLGVRVLFCTETTWSANHG
jgi:hypothetical protein